MRKIVSISLDADLHKEFAKHCKDNGMSVSGRLEVLLSKDLEGKDGI